MATSFRKLDIDFHTRFTEALRRDVFGAQPQMSIDQVAASITRGTDDPRKVSSATLYKALEGEPRIAPYKIPLMRHVTGNTETMRELCHMAGGHYVEVPALRDDPQRDVIAKTVSEFAEFLKPLSESLIDGTVTKDQSDDIKREGQEAIEAILAAIKASEQYTAGGART